MTKRRADYCPDCGTALETRGFDGRDRRYCSSCESFVFQNPSPGGHVVVLDGDRVLLIERAIEPDIGAWAVPGGYLEVDEPARVGAARELEEEAGLTVDPAALELLRTDLDVDDPAAGSYLSVCFVVERARTQGRVEPGPECADARFWDPGALLAGDERTRAVDLRRVEATFERLRGESPSWS